MKAKLLNESCVCRTLDTALLKSHLESEELLKGIYEEITLTRPNLFSATTVFISQKQLEAVTKTISAIEETIKAPEYRKTALICTPEISKLNLGPKGVFMGYDFHLSDLGPQLIEINTNAGGALLNVELAKAQHECGPERNLFFESNEELFKLDQKFTQMFLNEWKLQRGTTEIGLIAIVDDNPKRQYLYPEFQLFQRLFTKSGIKSVIADPKELIYKDEKLWYGDEQVAMVYNRLTDFYLEDETHLPLRRAFESSAVVLTPAPYHHALYANKTNLATFTSEEALSHLGIPKETQETLSAGIPRTEVVKEEMASDLWKRRRELFFKPVSGFGSKAAYRGEKITHKVWDEILKSKYVAQKLVPPSKRLIQVSETNTDLKLDIRAYVYDGEIQLLAARLYSGQTTNFRTAGGGFAPVVVLA